MARRSQEPGIYERRWEEGEQHYTIAIPAGYTPGEPRPLVIALHWGGRVTPFFGRGMLEGLVAPGLAPLAAVMVAPDRREEAWAGPTGAEQVLALLNHVSRRYAVDAARVLLCGYSMGGIGSWYLGAHHPQRFSAALVMAAKPPAGIPGEGWQLPLYAVHSRDDELFPYAPTQTAVATLAERGVDARFQLLEGPSHHEVSAFVPALRRAVPWIERAWGTGR